MLTKLTTITIASTALLAALQTSAVPTNSTSMRQLKDGSCWKLALDVDILGHDIGTALEKQPEQCVRHCDDMDACSMMTWTKYEGGTCWLKQNVEPGEQVRAAVLEGASSVIYMGPCKRVDATLGKCEMVNGEDDIRNEPAMAPKWCYGICAATPECEAFTWTPHNGGTCTLKKDLSYCVPSDTAESGVLFD